LSGIYIYIYIEREREREQKERQRRQQVERGRTKREREEGEGAFIDRGRGRRARWGREGRQVWEREEEEERRRVGSGGEREEEERERDTGPASTWPSVVNNGLDVYCYFWWWHTCDIPPRLVSPNQDSYELSTPKYWRIIQYIYALNKELLHEFLSYKKNT
jgi:hypothetical protein